jgi:hypothetical protein
MCTLLEVAAHDPQGAMHRGRREHARPRRSRTAAKPALRSEQVEHPLVLDVARHRDDGITGVVSLAMQRAEVASLERRHALGSAQDRVAVRMLRPDRLVPQFPDEVVRRIEHAIQLLEHHVPFEVQVRVTQQWPLHEVGEDVEGQRQVGVENMRLKGRVVAGGECVEGAAARLERHGDLAGRAPFGALEDEVFEQVGYAHLGAGFVAACGTNPDARRGRPNARNAFGDHDETVGTVGAKESVVELDGTPRRVAHGFGRRAFRDKRIRPRSSTSSSLTCTMSPFLTTSSVFSTRL